MMDQHKTLNLMVDSLFTENVLKHWSILKEKSGSILLKMRFVGIDGDANSPVPPEKLPIKLKAVSHKQVERSNQRAMKYKANQTETSDKQRNLKSASNVGAFNGTRSRDVSNKTQNSAENNRGPVGDSPSPIKHLSPESVINTPEKSDSPPPIMDLDSSRETDENCQYDQSFDSLQVLQEHSVFKNCQHFLCSSFTEPRPEIHYPEVDYKECTKDCSYEDEMFYCSTCESTKVNLFMARRVSSRYWCSTSGHLKPVEMEWVCGRCMANGFKDLIGCVGCTVHGTKPSYKRVNWPDEFTRRCFRCDWPPGYVTS